MKRAAAMIAAAVAVAIHGVGGVAEGATWNGGTGNWNTGTNWTGGVPNTAGATALIDGGKAGASTVTLDISPSITSLTVDAGDTLNIAGSRTLTLSGGATVNGTVSIAGGDDKTGLVFNGAQTLGGSGQVTFAGPSFLTNFIGGTGPLTIGSGITVRTDTQSGTFTAANLTNQGVIQNQTFGTVMEIKGDRFLNSGTIRCTGGLMFITASSWTNTGTIVLGGNGLVAFGGTVTTSGLNLAGLVRTGGVLLVTGLLDNTNATLPLTAATGSFDLSNGGILRGGTVTTTGGPQLFVGQSAVGTLDGVTIRCFLNVQSGGTLHVANGLRIENGIQIGLDSSGQATSMVFDTAQTLSGNGQLRFAGNELASNFINGSGALTIGPGIAVFPQSSSKGGTFNVATLVNQGSIFGENAEGTVTVNSPTFVNNGTLRAEFEGTLVLNSGVSGTGSASVGPTGKMRATFLRQGSLSLEGTAGDPTSFGRVTINTKATGGQTSVVKSLSIQTDGANKPLGVLDLADTALVVDYTGGSPIASVRRAIVSGYAGGAWTGPGVTSSVAAANSGRGLGYAEASEALGAGGGTFEGQPADGSSVVVRYTLYGDATLDGVVDFNDLVKLAQNYNTNVSATGDSWWFRGDFTYDGIVDFNDLVKLAQNYNTGLPTGPVPGAGGGFSADLAVAAASVPEPGWSAVAGVSATVVGLRRRRRRG